ncbi:hypothetical protein HYPSUDRAFT_74067 [Hypholoma sublateritium FD-334 SS-4]|uniref:DUF6534 domain-containing protein n=1 Tax=Hypholoma sublateritium (strain FD-334 SS-4) TaxID=945553 RepID=A0A0D2PDG5_HYPSF|nr:hypothetical protein HYPSUDRAFT_74067 [Hypholoma sublateritium FD-334 SS-4]
MDSQAAAAEAYIVIVQGIYRTVLIGYLLATSLYGITILQTFFYFRHYSKDYWPVKITVILLSALDTVATGLVTASLYTYLVDGFGKPILDIDIIPLIPKAELIWTSTFATENGIVTAIIWVVQLFYAFQIWLVSRSKLIPAAIISLSLVAFALGISELDHFVLSFKNPLFWPPVLMRNLEDTFTIFQNPNLATLAVKKDNIVRGVIKGITVVADIIIASSLVTFFHSKRTGIKRQDEMTGNILDKLIVYAGSRGALLTLCQIVYFILFTAFPNHTYWLPAHQMIPKVYVNSVLASLNARKAFERVKASDDTLLSNLNTTTSLSFRTMHGEGTNRVVITKEITEDVDGKKTHLVESQ